MTGGIRTFAEFSAQDGVKARLRCFARDLAIRALALRKSPEKETGWIRFPFWHHVFDDERKGFERQLAWMKRYGDFLSLSDAVALLKSGRPIDGRYFCLTFDDGFKNVLTNGAPSLDRFAAKATVYLATAYTGERDPNKLKAFYDTGGRLIDFLDWDDCKAWLMAGHGIGSHTRNHACLSRLDEDRVMQELAQSKADVETHLGIACRHFCAPFGVPDRHFDAKRDPALAAGAGYDSFATGRRGRMEQGGDPLFLMRDHLLANAEDGQLRYFLGD